MVSATVAAAADANRYDTLVKLRKRVFETTRKNAQATLEGKESILLSSQCVAAVAGVHEDSQ